MVSQNGVLLQSLHGRLKPEKERKSKKFCKYCSHRIRIDSFFVVLMTFPLSSETPDVKHSRNIASLYNWPLISFRLLVMLIKSQLCDL